MFFSSSLNLTGTGVISFSLRRLLLPCVTLFKESQFEVGSAGKNLP